MNQINAIDDETLASFMSEQNEKSTIFMTLSSKLSFQDAKIINEYSTWKKYDFDI